MLRLVLLLLLWLMLLLLLMLLQLLLLLLLVLMTHSLRGVEIHPCLQHVRVFHVIIQFDDLTTCNVNEHNSCQHKVRLFKVAEQHSIQFLSFHATYRNLTPFNKI